MREVTLASSIRTAVNAKVTAQQTQEQQKFELATAEQQADIQRIRALATADAQTITTCGGVTQTIVRDGKRISTVVPNPLSNCTVSQFTPAYLQYTYIQALQQLAMSGNTATLVLPFDQNLTPLLNLNTGSGTTTVTSPTSGP